MRQRFQMDGWWTAIQFDRAVTWFGNHVESLTGELVDDGHGHMKPKTTLEDVLSGKSGKVHSDADAFIALAQAQGAVVKLS